MWRFVFFVVLLCSIGLNIYLFMQLNVRFIENKLPSNIFQQNISQQKSTKTKSSSASQQFADKITKQHDKTSASDNASKQVEQIENAIKTHDFYLAKFLIINLANENAQALPEVRAFWLQSTQRLINQSLFSQAEDSYNAYLDFQQNDSDFLYLRIESQLQQELYLQAITSAYEIQHHVFDETNHRSVMLYARTLVQQQIDIFIENNLWSELISFIEQVNVLDPENLSLQWFFAQTQYQIGEYSSAKNAVQPLLSQPNFKVKAEALLSKINLALRKPESIQLKRRGEHFIVQGTMNNTFNVSLMLDTGASISLLSEQAFEQLNQYTDVEYIKQVELNTAGGRITASIYQVAEFEIQGYVLEDFIFAVSAFASGGSDGLLGMNYLSAFDFHIDQSHDLLILKNK